MNESEFLEAINLHASNVITSFSVYLTYLFGYIVGGYAVGSKMRMSQISIVSSIYVLSSLVWIGAILTHAHSFATIVDKYPQYIPSPLWSLPWPELAGAISLSALFGSLYFVYDVRSYVEASGT
jgi:hypothetical protein